MFQYVLPPQKPEHVGKKCLILDLDETLVHSAFKPVSNADFIIPILIDDKYHNVYVLKRPHVQEFLEKMAAHFELVVFTASVSNYADPVLDLLDPKGFVQYRLYREHCVQYNLNYVKDLSVLGRPLEDCIIIDNNPMAYAFQPSNAIPCATWIDDMEDDELVELQPFLIGLKAIPDVRTVLGVDSDDAYDSVVV
ncbi:CTD (Carboxy-terminal domain, RNA polymerase II, polypeptide A) small [Physocladia obscura]|uniref:CTD (Carboxy-terminal domain, RNA polymerase II, polypeptide A) small n=1 Tax=Physocladia obscura TaxID=109957 RepID=A0AAD5SNT3_9FUNG|nr:CTD (Carboxy-terminal domain, RNA polymerase II, polypeptide A) small [Physocladia obscura]